MKIQKNNIKETLKSIMREESDYQKFFRKSLKAAGKSIPDMTDSEKKAFFNKIDNAWQAKGEKKENESFRGKFGVSEAKATPHLTDSEQQKIAKAIEKATGVSTDYEITDTRYNTGASDFGLDGGQESLLFVGKDDDGFNISVEVDGRQSGFEQAKNFNGAMKSAMKLAKKFKKQLTTETFSNKNESATKAIDLLLKNKGMKDAIKNDKVKVIRKALEDEGFNTKGISDKDILTLAKNLQNESINEIEYKDAISNFNKELEKNPSVKKIASHYKKPTKSIVKALQPMLTVLRYKDKSIKSVSIDFTDAASGPTKVKLSKTYTQNESINEAFKHIIQVDTPNQIVSKKIASQIMALAKKGVRSKEIGLELGFTGNTKLATDTFQKVKNRIYFDLDKNESINEATDKKTLELIHTGLGKPKSMPNPVNIYRKWESIKKKHKLNDDALGDYFTTYFKKEYDMARKFYMSNESVVNESLKFNLIDPKTDKVLKKMSLDRPKKEAEKIEQTLNKKLSSTAKSRGYYWTTASIGESVVNEASKADTIRKSMPGYVGPKFAKKASDEDILAMADLKDEKAKIHNRYMKSIDDKIKKLQKKYKVNESVNELVNEENARFNKWLLKFIDNYMKGSEKPGTPEYQWIIKTLFQHTLHDANFHSEAKKVEKIFSRAKEPNKAEQLDRLLLNKAEDIAAKAKWDGYDIIDGFAYVSAMRIGGPKLDPIKALKNESVVNENFSKEDIEKLRDVVLDAKGAQNIGKELKKAGFKYDFSTEPIPLYMIKKGSKKFVLVNKRYADNPDFVVYGIAGGLLGS